MSEEENHRLIVVAQISWRVFVGVVSVGEVVDERLRQIAAGQRGAGLE